jgi:hypothetical protein
MSPTASKIQQPYKLHFPINLNYPFQTGAILLFGRGLFSVHILPILEVQIEDFPPNEKI